MGKGFQRIGVAIQDRGGTGKGRCPRVSHMGTGGWGMGFQGVRGR